MGHARLTTNDCYQGYSGGMAAFDALTVAIGAIRCKKTN